MGYTRFPLTPALSLGRGRMVHRHSTTPVSMFAQLPLAKHLPNACGSLSLRERVRVRGNSRSNTRSVAHPRDSSGAMLRATGRGVAPANSFGSLVDRAFLICSTTYTA